jgi:chorismate mutase
MTDTKDIENLRSEIDQIDDSLLKLFNERARTAMKVGDQSLARKQTLSIDQSGKRRSFNDFSVRIMDR